ncbi:MAG: hypothetical protein GY793_01890 [Proteobacteria bacterium]|nr:hypothetical protein [Pseudomonadota bacterium]
MIAFIKFNEKLKTPSQIVDFSSFKYEDGTLTLKSEKNNTNIYLLSDDIESISTTKEGVYIPRVKLTLKDKIIFKIKKTDWRIK